MIFGLAALVGIVLPLVFLAIAGETARLLRKDILYFVILIVIQIATEAILAASGHKDWIKFSATLFVAERLLRLGMFWSYREIIRPWPFRWKNTLIGLYFTNIGVWLFVFFQLLKKIYPSVSRAISMVVTA